jgi:hypothetical protein
MSSNPFADLDLAARPDLTDTEVRDAWRTVAAATHPDRDDGGNPARYAAASAAYAILRTPWARSEAYADLAARTIPATPPPPAAPIPRTTAQVRLAAARIRHGRPLIMALRILAAALLAAAALHSGTGPAHIAPALTGIATWLALTIGADLAPPPGR